MKRYLWTVGFVVVCATVLVVLLKAPPVKTARIPDTPDHKEYKQYERCPACHLPGGKGPEAAKDHIKNGNLLPDHVKCYMCHKQKGA